MGKGIVEGNFGEGEYLVREVFDHSDGQARIDDYLIPHIAELEGYITDIELAISVEEADKADLLTEQDVLIAELELYRQTGQMDLLTKPKKRSKRSKNRCSKWSPCF